MPIRSGIPRLDLIIPPAAPHEEDAVPLRFCAPRLCVVFPALLEGSSPILYLLPYIIIDYPWVMDN
jgi:hypothetical protein